MSKKAQKHVSSRSWWSWLACISGALMLLLLIADAHPYGEATSPRRLQSSIMRKRKHPSIGSRYWMDMMRDLAELERPTYEEREQEVEERHPGDALLQTQNADGSQSYILSGY
eukprot:c31748_g1_i1 orf=153-491(+)